MNNQDTGEQVCLLVHGRPHMHENANMWRRVVSRHWKYVSPRDSDHRECVPDHFYTAIPLGSSLSVSATGYSLAFASCIDDMPKSIIRGRENYPKPMKVAVAYSVALQYGARDGFLEEIHYIIRRLGRRMRHCACKVSRGGIGAETGWASG